MARQELGPDLYTVGSLNFGHSMLLSGNAVSAQVWDRQPLLSLESYQLENRHFFFFIRTTLKGQMFVYIFLGGGGGY